VLKKVRAKGKCCNVFRNEGARLAQDCQTRCFIGVVVRVSRGLGGEKGGVQRDEVDRVSAGRELGLKERSFCGSRPMKEKKRESREILWGGQVHQGI